MEKIKVGRSSKNDVTYTDPSISNYHLEVEFKSYSEYIISDLGSTNGTYVNDLNISSSSLKVTDKLTLGSLDFSTKDFFDDINKFVKKNKSDFNEEYKKVMRLFEQYQGRKNSIVKPPLLPTVLKLGSGIVIILVLVFYENKIPGGNIYPFIMAVGLIPVVVNMLSNSQVKKSEKLDLLKLEFEDRLVCPKCQSTLLNHSITYWKGKTGCSNARCDAIFQ